jgi:glucosamine kinase
MMTRGSLYLGVDGGGSRCRARIENEHGIVLGEGGSGPATTRLGIDKAWRSITRACEAATDRAGLAREGLSPMHAGIGLAGLGRRGAEAALRETAHPFQSIRFVGDGPAACLGAPGRCWWRTGPLG